MAHGHDRRWALLDFAYYGNTISSPEVLKRSSTPAGSLLHNTAAPAAHLHVFALPGYWLAVALAGPLGPQEHPGSGFTMMALTFLLIGLVPA